MEEGKGLGGGGEVEDQNKNWLDSVFFFFFKGATCLI